MKVNFYLSGDPARDGVIQALYDGCPEDKQLIHGFEYTKSDIAVVFGVYKSKVPASWPRGRVIDKHKAAGNDVVILETGYIHRGDGVDNYYACGLNGLNGRADFKNKNMPSDRFEKLNITPQPWGDRGDKIILCGQVPQDASVDHVDIMKWLHYARNQIKALSKKEIIFRPHPLAKVGPINGCDYSKKPLTTDLRRAWACVTFNSNTAVEAILEGIPSFAFDEGSMAWEVTDHDFDYIEAPHTPDREQWLSNLAYTQWKPSEMRSGEAWNHLFR